MTNIDEFYKLKNEEFILDNRMQDLHWEKMQNKLQPKKINWKYLIIAAMSILTLTLLFINSKKEQKQLVTNKMEFKNDTTFNKIKEIKSDSNVIATSKTIQLKTENKNIISIVKPTQNTVEKIKDSIKPKSLSKVLPNIINKEANFYIDLSKEPEIFNINPTIANNIKCKQGTLIYLAPNAIIDSLGNEITEPISLVIQEYYRLDEEQNTAQKKIATAGMLKYSFYKGIEELKLISSNKIIVKMSSPLGTNNTIKVITNDDALPEKLIEKMNWISNEKFLSDERSKIEYIITLDKKFDANTFMSQIAFPKYNAILPGNIINNSLQFTNIPIAENIYFLSLGKIGNKYFSCSKKLVSGNTQIKQLDFIEISETLYKQQIDLYSKLGKSETE